MKLPSKKTIPLMVDVTEAEMDVVNNLSIKNDMSYSAVVRAALRHYHLLITRLEEGETFSFSGDKERSRKFMEDLANEIISVR